MTALWTKFTNNFRKFPQYKNVIKAIIDTEPPEEFFYSEREYFEILAEFYPNIIVNILKSETRLNSINVNIFLDLIIETSHNRDYGDIGKGLNQILVFILESKFDIIDTIDPYQYVNLSEINPSLLKKLLDKAKRKLNEKNIINSDYYAQYLEKLARWIFERYDYEMDYGNEESLYDYGTDYGDEKSLNEYQMEDQEKEIVFTFLNKNISSSLLKEFPDFFESLFVDILYDIDDLDKNSNLIASLLISDDPNFFEKIPTEILRRVIRFDSSVAQLYFKKIDEKYNSNKEQHDEWLIKKCTEFVNLLILYPEDVSIQEDLSLYSYDSIEKVYYACNYNKILPVLFKIHPPIKLFTQNRLFYKFLSLHTNFDRKD